MTASGSLNTGLNSNMYSSLSKPGLFSIKAMSYTHTQTRAIDQFFPFNFDHKTLLKKTKTKKTTDSEQYNFIIRKKYNGEVVGTTERQVSTSVKVLLYKRI